MSCYCHIIGMCVFHERQHDICRRCAYSHGFAKAVHMFNDRQRFDPAFKTTATLVVDFELLCCIFKIVHAKEEEVYI